MRLFIAEKPSLARAIADGLGKQTKLKTHIQCGNDIVTWCFGHLLDSAPPEYYHPDFKQWKAAHLPIIPNKFTLIPSPKTKEQLNAIKTLLKNATSVVNAGDPDREGQLLVDEVLEYLKYKGPTQRIWLASLDPTSVSKALNSLKDNQNYRGFRNAAESRRIIDWLAGMNLTRAMTIFGRSIGFQGVLSLGRVQTPTLALVVARDREIENFKPIDYAALSAVITHANGSFSANLKVDPDTTPGTDQHGRITDFNAAKSIRDSSTNIPGKIIKADKKAGKDTPPLTYALSSLQKDASSALNLGAQKVLDIAQKLYEQKLTTYPRTDCGFLPEEQFQDAGRILKMLEGLPHLADAANKADPKRKSPAWNTKKITAHHGIIPTGLNAGGLTGDEKAVYTLIAARYIQQFYPNHEFVTTSIQVQLQNNTVWEAKGKTVTEMGWKAVGGVDSKAVILPSVTVGDQADSGEVRLERKQTKPPARFTEGSLIEAMSFIHLFIKDQAARARLKETSGLGTEATRANIIETLKTRGYITAKNKAIISTDTGRSVIDLCPPMIKDIVTTALMEDSLADIQADKAKPKGVVESYAAKLGPMIDALFQSDARKLGVKVPDTYPCPNCGKALARRKGKSGFFWGCSGYPDCNTTCPDEKGKPGKPNEVKVKVEPPVDGTFKCTACGGQLKYGVSKAGKPYWACFAKSAKHSKDKKPKFFNCDDSGKPVLDK